MATFIQAIATLRPRVVLQKRIGMADLAAFIAMRTGLSEGAIIQVLLELRDAVIYFVLRGHPVGIVGLGTYTPVADCAGRLRIGHRADLSLKRAVAAPGGFRSELTNPQHVGKSSAELIATWNAAHPDNPVV